MTRGVNPMKYRNNPIFNFITLDGKGASRSAICRVEGCPKGQIKGASTSHYINHLKIHHNKLYRDQFLPEFLLYRSNNGEMSLNKTIGGDRIPEQAESRSENTESRTESRETPVSATPADSEEPYFKDLYNPKSDLQDRGVDTEEQSFVSEADPVDDPDYLWRQEQNDSAISLSSEQQSPKSPEPACVKSEEDESMKELKKRSGTMSQRTPRLPNPIYNFVVVHGKRQDGSLVAICRVAGCSRNRIKSNSTTHYIRHLKSHHKKLFDERFLKAYTRYRSMKGKRLRNSDTETMNSATFANILLVGESEQVPPKSKTSTETAQIAADTEDTELPIQSADSNSEDDSKDKIHRKSESAEEEEDGDSEDASEEELELHGHFNLESDRRTDGVLESNSSSCDKERAEDEDPSEISFATSEAAQPQDPTPNSGHPSNFKQETLKELKKRVLGLKAVRLEQLIQMGNIEIEMLLAKRT